MPVPVRCALLARRAPRRDGRRGALIKILLHGESHEEKTLAETLLAYDKGARHLARSKHIERWLDQLNGWANA